MRVASSTIQQGALNGMLRQQAQLARTQNEVATGKRIQTPADDPPAAARLAGLERSLAENVRFSANSDSAVNRLNFEEQAIADVTNSLQRLQELALQANNTVVDTDSRRMISAEMRSRLQEIRDIANRQDASGDYLFSGFRSNTRPFEREVGGIVYRGDTGGRKIQIGPDQSVADGHSGFAAFVDIREGNGTFITSASSASTGTGVISAGSLFDPAAWVADDYTISFTSPTAYEVRDSASALVSSGTYASAGEIQFRGISVTISGAPAAGDTFNANAAGTESVFDTIDSLIATVEQATATPASRALFSSTMATVIGQLSASTDHMSSIRAEIGARLNTLESAANARDQLDVETQKVMSDLRDVDYAEAITRMNAQLVGLQAAQQSYTRIAGLTLFDYL
jgi:flagellar hook-associated protein 3 FlgL